MSSTGFEPIIPTNSDRRPTPETARPPGSALHTTQLIYNLRTERGELSALGNGCFTPEEAPPPGSSWIKGYVDLRAALGTSNRW